MKHKLIKHAIEEEKKGIFNKERGTFGAIIVKNNEVVGRGHNQVLKNNDPTCHGEMQAIRDACKNLNTYDLTGCELYTTGYPCPMCRCAIQWANINKVYYGCNVEDTEKIGFRDKQFYENEDEPIECLRDECLKLYNEYEETIHTIY